MVQNPNLTSKTSKSFKETDFIYGGVSFVLLSGRSHHGDHHPTVAKKGGAVVLRVVF